LRGEGEGEREAPRAAGDLLRVFAAALFLLDSVSPSKLTEAPLFGVEGLMGGGSPDEVRGVEAAEGVLSPPT